MKLIFLDIDGVLVTAQCRELPRSMQQPWPRCVKRLNELLATTGANIVVSSVWRFGKTTAELQTLLDSWGVVGSVVGKTTEQHDDVRGRQIAEWLIANDCEASNFVILDDDDDMGGLGDRLVQTSFQHGLSRRHVRAAIKLLGRKDK